MNVSNVQNHTRVSTGNCQDAMLITLKTLAGNTIIVKKLWIVCKKNIQFLNLTSP